MSVIAANPNSISFGFLGGRASGNGASTVAKTLRSLYQGVCSNFVSSALADARIKSIQDSLREILASDSLEFEALPEAVSETSYILQSLPDNIPTPELLIEPNGAIACEWYKDAHRVFVLSFAGNQTIEFAALLGDGNEIQGRHYYTDGLPIFISASLKAFVEEV